MKESNNWISNILYEYRKKHGLSQQMLANILGVKQGQISIWERSKNIPSKLRAESIKRILDER